MLLNLLKYIQNFFASDWKPFIDLVKDFLLPTALALGAAYTAYWIFVEETRRERENEIARKVQERDDKLMYFYALLKDVLRLSIIQTKNLKKYLKMGKVDGINFHMMSFIVLQDFERISKGVDLEEYLLAYADRYPEHRLSSITEFKTIINSVDFLYEMFGQIKVQLEIAQKYDYDRKKKFQQLNNEIHNLLGHISLSAPSYDKNLAKELEILSISFATNTKGKIDDLQVYYNFLSMPFNELANKYLDPTRDDFEQIKALALLTRDSKSAFENIVWQNNIEWLAHLETYKRVYRANNKLEIASKKMFADIET